MARTGKIGFSRQIGFAPTLSQRFWFVYAPIALMIGFLGYISLIPYSVLIILITVISFIDLLFAMDDGPPVRELSGLLATVQLLFAPLIMYLYYNDHLRYRMYVPDTEYFPYAIPAVCAFLFFLKAKVPIGSDTPRLGRMLGSQFKVGAVLVFVGLVASILSRFGPGSLGFFFYLVANLRYVGAIYIFASGHKLRWPIIAMVGVGLYLTSAKYGMFHEIILWGTLGGSYWFVGMNRPMWVKVTGIVVVLFVISLIQGIKPEYRKRLNENPNASLVDVLVDYVQSDELFSEKWAQFTVVRVAQGWIVSAAMNTVPSRVRFAEGKTIKDAVVAALVPRFIMPNKLQASSRVNVNAYTGLRLGEKTSMGLSPLGEGYVNFGVIGGIITMAVFGLILNVSYRILCGLSWRHEFYFFCMPLVFLQVVKMETEFLMLFNHLVKASIIVVLAYQGVKFLGLAKPLQVFVPRNSFVGPTPYTRRVM